MSQDETSFGFRTQSVSAGKCPSCGGNDLIRGLEMGQGVEVGPFGFKYRAAKIFTGTEQLRAEMCRSCGTVVRFYVKETNRNWVQKE